MPTVLNEVTSSVPECMREFLFLQAGNLEKNPSKGIRFKVLYPHDLPPLAGLYTKIPFQSPEGYSRATGSI